ncbi:flagellar filament capping protein FliD [Butyrivibrio sp. INlla16]|uniref:flagellar filament capping protein FliD n=1 Tax=Butyrivibrio sp. INlla16 TaxID=1520807 RepID=UPI00088AF7F8|nr:flagellar filament capping protein FliD [Butyrivibrio sp. INlla16]SDB68912.1 flagellar hook-associated protein 2 [Butyrivibrio sp. INlla16]
MTMRITGLASGLDTESIITELTKVQSNKVDKIKSDQKKHDMKMDKWKELNKKVVDFYNKTLSNLRFDSSYIKKTTSISNSDAVTVSTSGTAMNGAQKMSVDKLATSAYLTGSKITSVLDNFNNTTKITGSTSVDSLSGYGSSELAPTDSDLNGKIRIKFGKAPTSGPDNREFVDIEIDGTKSIADAIDQIKSAKTESGYSVNANFDANQGRVYMSSSEMGEDASFSIDFGMSDRRVLAALGIDYSNTGDDAPVYNEGADAQITLNGVEYKSNNNTFDINGLTITAKQVASDISLTTSDDTSGIYDMVKGFIKEYNDLIGEMYTLYNADSGKDYDILTKEQKDEMTDDEIEEWNKKIDESLLSKDPTIFRVMSEMKNIMMNTYNLGEIDEETGKEIKTSFWSFRISTLGYFESEEGDRAKWHIYGDEDDDKTSGKEDRLKKKIETDPELVRNFFKNLSKDLYTKLGDMMKSTEFSSAYTLYEDKQMKTQVDKYKTQLKDAQDKLGKMEDKYYDKFAQMEKAMTKLNEQTNSLAGMLGTG